MSRVWTFDAPLKEPDNKCGKTGKLKMSKIEAQEKAQYWREEQFARMNAYKCGDHWHIGNRRFKPPKRKP